MRMRKQKNSDDQYKHDLALTGTATVTEDNRWAVHLHRFDDDARRDYWIQNKAEILKKWIQDHPGSRPYDFWVFDVQGFRQKISAIGPDNIDLQECGCHSIHGVPDWWTDPHEVEQHLPVFEAQAAYLKRHGMMTLAEKNRLKQADFTPERLKY